MNASVSRFMRQVVRAIPWAMNRYGSGARVRRGTQPAAAAGGLAVRGTACAVLLWLGLAASPCPAQIVPAGAHAPAVINTARGLPQVNVTKPTGAGVSLNTYSQFDVQRAGALLNNSPVIVNTQLAGQISGNPNFGANDAARIIVNQVSSSNPSQLRGYVEVAGQKADVVIANPSGLVVDGGGFINTSRGVLTTGNPLIDANGGLGGFNVTGGTITVQGAGLNATNIDQVDLIARAVQANAAIYANTLNVVTGANQVDYASLNASPVAGNGAAPGVSIDVSQLGGMYANRIVLAGTENGVGVANAGTIAAQAGDLTLQGNGRLVQGGQMTASGNVSIGAARGVQNSGTIYAQHSVSVNTGADVANAGVLAAQQDTTVNAGSVASTGILGAGVNSDGSLGGSGNLTVTSAGMLSANGQNVAPGALTLYGSALNLSGAQTWAGAALNLTATGGNLNLAGANTGAGASITANAAGTLTNDQGVLSSGTGMQIAAGSVSNAGGQMTAGTTLGVSSGGALVNTQGVMQSGGQQNISAATLDNTAGSIVSLNGDGLALSTSGLLTNGAGGQIGGNGDVTVQGGTVVNQGTVSAQGSVQVSGQTVDNSGGLVQGAQNATVNGAAQFSNSGGTLLAGQTATVSATTLDNSAGTVQANQLALNAVNLVNHGGTLTQTGSGPMTVAVSGTLDNSAGGTIQTNSTDVTLAPGTLNNDGGSILHAGTGTLTLAPGNGAGTASNAGGRIVSNGQVAINAGTLNNAAGSVTGQTGLAATVGGALNSTGGQLLSGADLGLTGGTVTNDSGTVGANANATITATALSNRSGVIVAPNLATNIATTFDNSAGNVQASQLALTAANLVNEGGTLTQTGSGPMAVSVSGTLDNSAGGTIQTNSTDLALAPATLNNDNGSILHAGTGTLTLAPGNGAGTASNAGGRIVSNGQVAINAGTLNNAAGSVMGQTGLAAAAGGTLDNTGGQLLSNADISLTGGTVTNDSGTLGANGNATITATALSNRSGIIVAPNLAATVATTFDNSAGNVQANQLALTAMNLVNQGGTLTQFGSGPMAVAVSGTLDNSAGGTIQTNSTDLALSPATLNNDSGSILHAGTGTLTLAPGAGAGQISNAGGQIISAGAIAAQAGSLNNGGGTLAAQQAITAFVAGDVNNANGLIRSPGSLTLASGGALTDTAGRIQSGTGAGDDASTLAVQADSIDSSGGLVGNLGSGSTTVQAGSQLVNQGGTITGNGAVSLAAPLIVNTQGGQISGAGVAAQAESLDNTGGQIGTLAGVAGDVTLSASGTLANTGGQIGAGHDLTVSAGTLSGGGLYAAGNDVTVNVQGDFSTNAAQQFSAGHNLEFTLPGTFSNGTTLQAVNGLGVSAGDIMNSGTLMAGGTLTTHSATLENTGSIVGGSVSLNATQALSNVGPAALIGATDSNGVLELLSPDIENRDDTTASDTQASTAIYGLGSMVLAGGKDAGGNYTNANLIDNQSALIQSAGDMALHANQVTNTRRVMSTSGYTQTVDAALIEQLGISLSGQTGQVGVANPQSIGGVFPDPPHGGQWNSTYQYTTYTGEAQQSAVTAISPGAQIIAGGSLDASQVGLLQNHWSQVAAAGDIAMPATLEQDSWAGQTAPGVQVTYSGQYHYNNYDNSEHDWQLPFGNAGFETPHPGGYTQVAPADIRYYALPAYESSFVAGGAITGTGVSISNTAGNAGMVSLGLAPGQSLGGVSAGGPGGAVGVTTTAGAQVSGSAASPGVTTASVPGSAGQVDAVIAHATALNVLASLSVPPGGLFHAATAPGAPYLIETNAAFTSQKAFISSDYYLQQLGLNPQTVEKRLGDGLYEQQLVQNQVTALTGRAVLGPYTDTQAMYEALMAAGASLAQSLNLPLGMSLSAQQVAALTSNVIILQTEVVNGQAVLVPVVYLAQASQQDMNGPLIAANDINLQNTQVFTNSGTVQATNSLTISGQQIDDAFGTLKSGGLMSLSTAGNIDLGSATLNAGSLALNAGGDLKLDTLTNTVNQVSASGATRTSTTLGPLAQISVTGDAGIVTGGNFVQDAGVLNVGGNLGLSVGGDWTLGAVQTGEHKVVERANGVSDTDINSVTGSTVKVGGITTALVGGNLTAQGAGIDLGGGGTLAAGGTISLGVAGATSTVSSNSSGSDHHGSYAETFNSSSEQVTGTTLNSGDTLNLVAGKDINVTGSTVSLEKGTATLAAAGDVNIGAATQTQTLDTNEQHSHGSVVSSTKVQGSLDSTATQSIGSVVSADAVNIQAGHDLTVQGSTVVGTNDVNLAAGNNVNITTSQDTLQTASTYQKKETGLLSNGGLSVSIGSRSQSDQQQASQVSNNASMVGSLDGNLNISAGNDLHVTGSVLYAGQDATMAGKTVTIDSAYNTASQAEQQQYHSAGLTIGLTNPVVSAIQTAMQMTSAAQHVDGDPRMLALAGATTALAAKNAYDAVGGDPVKAATTVGINISLGASTQHSSSTSQSSTAVGSTVSAGRNVTIAASGAGADSNINVVGSTISAGNNALLAAQGNVNLLAAQNTASQQSSSRGGSFGVGVSLTVGSKTGLAFTAGASGNRGNADGDSSAWSNTHVNAGNTLMIQSGGDTNLIGAVASGNQVIADVGGNLNIQSLQDTSTYQSKNQSVGVSISVCVPPLCYGMSSGSVSASQTKVSSNYASVNEQSGIRAGDGGFQIGVKGNTDLKGGVISSTDAAVQDGSNYFSTGSLTMSDIENHADYEGKGISANIGPVVSLNGSLTPGASSAGVAQQDGSADSVTRSGVSGIAGNESARTGDQESGIKPIFDAAKVQQEIDAQVKITQQFGEQASTALTNYVTVQRKNLQQQLEAATNLGDKAQIQSQLSQLNTEQRILNVLIGVVTGQVSVSAAQGVLSEAADLMRQESIRNSSLFAGVTDSTGAVLSNLSGVSAGVNGDGYKIGGTRASLDSVCGGKNSQCEHNADNSLKLNDLGQPKLLTGMTVNAYLTGPDGQAAASSMAGGIQGAPGTLFGIPYSPGSLGDLIVEAYAGTHDFIGGQLVGLYDDQGNAKRGMSSAEKTAHDVWSAVAIVPATPFAAATILPPQVWNAIAAILQVLK